MQLERLQRRLGELHATDLNALRRAYRSLCQHVSALEGEAQGLGAAVEILETELVSPEYVASQLGWSACVALAASVAHSTLKAAVGRNLLGRADVVARVFWVAGAALVVARLTTSMYWRWISMARSNAAIKRQIAAQVAAVDVSVGRAGGGAGVGETVVPIARAAHATLCQPRTHPPAPLPHAARGVSIE